MNERARTAESVDKEVDLDELVAASDTGARSPTGSVATLLFAVALAWSLFQLWIASPLPFMLGFGVFNDTEARSIHLAFAIFLAFTAYPAFSKSPRHYIPVQDWIFALLGAFAAAYLYLFYESLSSRPGAPIAQDYVVAVIGMILLLEATRRSLGPPLAIIAIVFLTYTFLGQHMPSIIAHKGNTLGEVVNHHWVTTEGVFGIALGVSTSFVFLFVLFGSLLDKGGAGNYFIQVAFSLMGHMRGGPAKAAVVSSAMTGLISGSSIANVVTTGTFTIPLMKKVGFSSEKAGAVEVASSVNGQIMPPVMGAAAFLMVEYVGIPYFDVVKHAFLPALISYIALVYIVHLEALKADMKGLPRAYEPGPLLQRLIMFLFGVVVLCAISFAVYYGIGWIRPVFGPAASWIIAVGLVVVYVGLIAFGSRYPELKMDDPRAPVKALPLPGPTIKAGLHFILPVVVLVWALMVERLSPGLSAFWGAVFMIFILVTQRPLFAFFRNVGDVGAELRAGFVDLLDGLVAGARNMIGIGIATATAGIIVGAVSQTGVGSALAEVVEVLSGGNILAILFLTAFLSLILGMGLPTTANYIVVSALLAPV
ncbi:MAG: TRAP transporter permease, partial [Pseudomonadota bacterium]